MNAKAKTMDVSMCVCVCVCARAHTCTWPWAHSQERLKGTGGSISELLCKQFMCKQSTQSQARSSVLPGGTKVPWEKHGQGLEPGGQDHQSVTYQSFDLDLPKPQLNSSFEGENNTYLSRVLLRNCGGDSKHLHGINYVPGTGQTI